MTPSILAATLAAALYGPAPCDCHDLPEVVALAVSRAQERQDRDPKHQADLDADIALGKEIATEVDKELKASENADMKLRLERIAGDLTLIANQTPVKVTWGDGRLNPFPYRFRLVKGEDVNAFSIPGGYIYVYEGLVKYAESDDELAGVLAHEISHASFRHVATLRREQSKLDAITLPLILISIFSGSAAAQGLGAVGQLTSIAVGSGWSQKAEESADYGAIQYMMASKYNPLGVLTFMERLAYDERNKPKVDWGIYRTHPPSRARAQSIRRILDANGVAIRRSQVTTTLRSDVRAGDEGVEVWFAGIRIHTFRGPEALMRADEAAVNLNGFFDQIPRLFEVGVNEENEIVGKGRVLLRVEQSDFPPDGETTRAALAEKALGAVKRAAYDLAYRTWEAF